MVEMSTSVVSFSDHVLREALRRAATEAGLGLDEFMVLARAGQLADPLLRRAWERYSPGLGLVSP